MKQGHNRVADYYLFGVVLYEMLVGIPPYFSNDREILFNNIKYGSLKIPKNISDSAKDLIIRLLERNPLKRLGAK